MSDNHPTLKNDRTSSSETDEPGQLIPHGTTEATGPRLVCLLVGMILGGLLMGLWWMLAGLVFGRG